MRMLDHSIQQPLQFVEASKRGKLRSAFLNKKFPGSPRLNFLQPREKILACNSQRIEISRSSAIGLQRISSQKSTQRNHADFLAKCFQIRSDEAMRMFGNLLQIHVVSQGHGAGVNPKNLQPCLTIGNSNFNLAIKAARASQRRIQYLGNISSAYNDNLPTCHKTVHQAKQLGNDALLNLAHNLSPLRRYRVNLIYKEDSGNMTSRFLEHLAESGLALAIKLPHDLWAIEMNKMHAALGCHGSRQQ